MRWVSPDPDLTALITAAGEEHNLGRRSNACAEGGDLMKLQLGRVAWPKGRGAAIRQLFRSPEAAGVSGQGR